MSGHIYSEEGAKVLALSGAWNSHLDMVKCDAEGDPLPDAPTTRLWQVRAVWCSSQGTFPSAASQCRMLPPALVSGGLVLPKSFPAYLYTTAEGSSPPRCYALGYTQL